MLYLQLGSLIWQFSFLYILSANLSIFFPVSIILIALLIFLSYHFYSSTLNLTDKLESKAEELKTAQSKLQDKKEEIEAYIESNIRLSQFSYVASHNLKSSLNTIKSFSNLLKSSLGDNLDAQEKEYFSYIEKAAAASEVSVIDTLYYAQVKSTPLLLKKINLTKLLEEVLASLKYIIDKRQAVIRLEKLPEKIIADEKQLKKVFEVLLTNAIKFTPDNKSPIIHIASENHKTEWLFKISDNGMGIKEIHQEKIFNEFIKLNNTYEYPGSGFGLTIGKNIIEKHGGNIWIESSSVNGSTFAFTIKK